MMATYVDLLGPLSMNSSAGDGRNFNEDWLNAYKGLIGQRLINIDPTNWKGANFGNTQDGTIADAAGNEQRAAEWARLMGQDEDRARWLSASGSVSGGKVTLGGQEFFANWAPSLNGGQGGWRLLQVNDAGVAGRRLEVHTDANGVVTGTDLNYAPNWDSTSTMMLGSVLAAAAAGTAVGAYGAGSAASGGAAATTSSTGLIGGGATAAGTGTVATGTGLGSTAGSQLGGMLASGAGGGATAAGGAAAGGAGVGGLGAGAATSVGGALASAAGGGSGSGGSSGTGNWWDSLISGAGNYLTSGQGIGTILGGLAGALGSGDQTMTQTSTTTPNDPTAINEAIENYRSLAAGDGGYTAAVNPYADAANPYLSAAIDAANADTIRNYNYLAPAKYSSGSSFGNSGLGFLEENERANVLSQMANTSATMRYQGYNQAATLADAFAQRTDAANQFNTGARMQANQGLIGGAGALGQTQTQSTTAPGNIWASTLGGALVGSQIGRGGIFGQSQSSRTTS